jgi:hypothetical protein
MPNIGISGLWSDHGHDGQTVERHKILVYSKYLLEHFKKKKGSNKCGSVIANHLNPKRSGQTSFGSVQISRSFAITWCWSGAAVSF